MAYLFTFEDGARTGSPVGGINEDAHGTCTCTRTGPCTRVQGANHWDEDAHVYVHEDEHAHVYVHRANRDEDAHVYVHVHEHAHVYMYVYRANRDEDAHVYVHVNEDELP